jgi:membrane protein YdbS with pleckstrin-like domain
MGKRTYVQQGWGLRAVLVLVFVAIVIQAWALKTSDNSFPYVVLVVSAALLGFTLVFFTSIKVTLAEDALEVRMGPGLVKRCIPLSEIQSVSLTKIPWHSVGLKRIYKGWLYSVGVTEALDIRMTDGRRYIVGIKEARSLWEAINERVDMIRGNK